MFSLRQKREIAEAIQKILRATGHPRLWGELNCIVRTPGI